MATASRFNRGYQGGMAAGAAPGGAYGSSFQSNFQSSMAAPSFASAPKPPAQQPFRPLAGMDYNAPQQPQQAPPALEMGSMFGATPLPTLGGQHFDQQPASPFGGPEPLPSFGGFRARGGPVMPGQAYVVGERGMEMFVPQQPGMIVPNQAMRSPMAATDSPMNRNYGGGLADRAATPVGRSGYDLNRIAQRTFRQTRDPNMMMSMDYRNLRRERMQTPQGMPAPQAMPMPAPQMPGGRLVPGRSAGSMVWQPDAPMQPDMPAQAMPDQRAGVPALPSRPQDSTPPNFNAPAFTLPMLPPSLTPQGGLDITQPLPASTLGGGAGLPPPPAFETQTIGGFDVLKQNTPEGMKYLGMKSAPPQILSTNALRMLNEHNQKNPDKQLMHTGQFEPNGQPILAPAKMDKGSAPRVTYTKDTLGNITGGVEQRFNPQTGSWEHHSIKIIDVNGDGIPDNQQGGGAKAGGAYFDNLIKPPAAAAPAGAPTATVTGQMPNVAYANNINPEQSLAAARDVYARTGNDAALKQHFQNFPSQAVQYGQRESQLWQQIGQMPTDTRQQIEQKMTKMREADRINAQMQAAAKGMPIPADYAVDPDRRPLLPPVRPYVAPQEDPFLVQSWQGAQSFAQDASAAIKKGAQDLAAYGKRNPLIVVKR